MQELIGNIDDVKKLDKIFSSFSTDKIGMYLPYINLEVAYQKYNELGDFGSRVFAAILDLKINYIGLTVLDFQASALWNQHNDLRPKGEFNILDHQEYFKKRLDVHLQLSNYIPKYRAMWDKIMGIFLLIYSEELYDKYNNAKSRKKEFKKLAANVYFLSDEFVKSVDEHLIKFDDKFRTAEIHRFGTLKKYSFLDNPFTNKDYIFLKSSSGTMIDILVDLDRIIDQAQYK